MRIIIITVIFFLVVAVCLVVGLGVARGRSDCWTTTKWTGFEENKTRGRFTSFSALIYSACKQTDRYECFTCTVLSHLEECNSGSLLFAHKRNKTKNRP